MATNSDASSDCLLFGFGTNDAGVMWFRADAVDSDQYSTIRAAGCGSSFTVIALDSGAVLASGSNECSQLGVVTEEETADELQVISQLAGQDVQEVCCGFDHSICLTKDGRVWAWGEKSSGQLAGASHSLMVIEDGSLIAFGSNLKGQLGIGFASEVDDGEDRALPRKVLIPGGEAVKACAGGGMHSLALTVSGKLLAWGCNTFCQAGDEWYTEAHVPGEVAVGREEHLTAVACGYNHSVVLSSSGAVFSFGRGKHGLLCNGNVMDCATPQRADALRGHVVTVAQLENRALPDPA